MDRKQFWSDKAYRQECLEQTVVCLGEVGAAHEGEQVEISLTFWEDPEGHTFVPVFTDLGHLEEIAEQDEPYLEMVFAHLLDMVRTETLIIDPETEDEWSLAPEEIDKALKV